MQVWDNDLNFKAHLRPGRQSVGDLHLAGAAPVPLRVELGARQRRLPRRGDTGEIYKMELDGTILGKFGKAGKALKEFSTVHEIDCRNPNELFVSEITDWRVQKIILKPQTRHISSKGGRQPSEPADRSSESKAEQNDHQIFAAVAAIGRGAAALALRASLAAQGQFAFDANTGSTEAS